MPRLLVSFDIPSIHHFVFGTDYAREVRGASGLIDELNRETIPRTLAGPDGEVVYANGGGGLIVLPDISEADAEARIAAAAAETRRRSGGALTLQAATAPWTPEQSFGDALATAVRARNARRRGGRAPAGVASFPFIRRCKSCGEEAASTVVNLHGSDHAIGQSCLAKREWWDRHRRPGQKSPWARIVENIEAGFAGDPDELRPEDFSSIAEAAKGRGGYLAVVYADGDRMGETVQRIHGQEEYRSFAAAIDGAVFAAVSAALKAHAWNAAETKSLADVLLVGGDDVVAVVPADVALRFACTLQREFSQEVAKRLAAAELTGAPFDAPFSLSVGVAFARGSQPFRDVVARAEELLRSAKRAERAVGEGGVDFADVSQTSLVGIEDARAASRCEDEAEVIQMYCRPLTQSGAAAFLDAAERLVASLTTSKMRRVLECAWEGPMAGRFAMARLIGHFRDSDRAQRDALIGALSDFGVAADLGWKHHRQNNREVWMTPLGDVEELLPFIER